MLYNDKKYLFALVALMFGSALCTNDPKVMMLALTCGTIIILNNTSGGHFVNCAINGPRNFFKPAELPLENPVSEKIENK